MKSNLELNEICNLEELTVTEVHSTNGGSELSDAVAYGCGYLWGKFLTLGDTLGTQRAGGNYF